MSKTVGIALALAAMLVGAPPALAQQSGQNQAQNQSQASPRAAQRKAPPSFRGITANRMMIGGKSANIAIANTSLLRQTLEDFRPERDPNSPINPDLGELIDEIEAANESDTRKVPGMTGLGGVLGHAFLEAARNAVLSGNYDRFRRVEISVHGQIEDFAYNAADGSGRINSITYIERTVIPAGNGVPNTKTRAYKWEIEVEPGGFTVVPKGTDPHAPFPGTMQFSDEMKQRIDSLGFQYKLWASGTKIVVKKVSFKANANNPNWRELKKSNPRFAKLYEPDINNCIDMLFVDEPPADLGDMGPPFYCLGRCANPMIVNTGM